MKKLHIYLSLILFLFIAVNVTGQSAFRYHDNIIEPCKKIQDAFNEYLENEDYQYSQLKYIVQNALKNIEETDEYSGGSALKFAALQFAKAAINVIGGNEDEFLINLFDETYALDQFVEKEEDLIEQQSFFATFNDIDLD